MREDQLRRLFEAEDRVKAQPERLRARSRIRRHVHGGNNRLRVQSIFKVDVIE